MAEAYLVDAVRTPVGKKKGGLCLRAAFCEMACWPQRLELPHQISFGAAGRPDVWAIA